MLKRRKILALPLILAAILIVLSLPGCGKKGAGPGETTAGELTTQELQQVMADSISAVQNATSYAFTLNMDVNAEAVGGSQAGKMGTTLKSSGDADITANNMQMDMEISMESDIPGNQGSQSVSAEIYVLADWMYMKMKISGMGEQWLKTPVTEDVEQSYNLDIVNQQLAPLESMGEIQFVKYESLDGSQCYVLKIVPDVESMKEWLDEQQMMAGRTDWDVLVADVFKELSYTVWLAKDTKLIKKMKLAMVMEMTAAQAGALETDFDKMTMDIEMSMVLKDYNEPVSITLPDEAEDAEEME